MRTCEPKGLVWYDFLMTAQLEKKCLERCTYHRQLDPHGGSSFDINTNDGYIEAQNPIDMKNEKIVHLALPGADSDTVPKKYVDNNIKSVNNKFPSYLKRDGSVSLT